jgi:transcriptional regulator with XRE-family HTH domain
MSTTVDRIFSLLDKRGIEQKEFARLIGTSDKTVSAWKTGRAKSYTKYLAKIAEVLGVTTDYLVNGNSDILITSHELPPQGSLDELLEAGELSTRLLFDNVKDFISTGSDRLISSLNSPSCALYSEIKFYDKAVEQTEKPIILSNNGLSDAEQALMDLFRQLTPDQQDMVIRIVQAAADKM